MLFLKTLDLQLQQGLMPSEGCGCRRRSREVTQMRYHERQRDDPVCKVPCVCTRSLLGSSENFHPTVRQRPPVRHKGPWAILHQREMWRDIVSAPRILDEKAAHVRWGWRVMLIPSFARGTHCCGF